MNTPIPEQNPADKETRIPPWAATVAAVAAGTALLIGWGELRFVRRDVYELEVANLRNDLHRFDERIGKHENDQADVAKELRAVSDRLIRIEAQSSQIAEKLGVARK